jgi:membrane associated rhomboid family serine protease
MGFPRFHGAVRSLVIFSSAIYVSLLLLTVAAPRIASAIYEWGVLSPADILHWQVWRFVTYGFLHTDPLNFLFAMLGIYFLGSAVEDRTGPRAFMEMFLIALIGAGVVGFALSLVGIVHGGAYGSGPAANAILMLFYLFYRGAPIMLFPIPIPIPVRYIVIFTAAVEGAYLLLSHFALFYAIQLLGMGMGFVWYRLMWRRTSPFAFFGAQMLSFRNSYHRWKRRRAGKKFQVYMRKHNQDPSDYFDEYGNFRPPDDKDKKNGGSTGGWVN